MNDELSEPRLDPNPGEMPITLTVSASGRTATTNQDLGDQELSLWDSATNDYLQPMPIFDAVAETPHGTIELSVTGEMLCATQVPLAENSETTTKELSFMRIGGSRLDQQYNVSTECPAGYPNVGEITMKITGSAREGALGFSQVSINVYWRAPWALS